jgi:hypothetical protein
MNIGDVVGTVGITIGGIEIVGTTGIGIDGSVSVGSGTGTKGSEPGVALGSVIAELTTGLIASNACDTSASAKAPTAMRRATRQPAATRPRIPVRTSFCECPTLLRAPSRARDTSLRTCGPRRPLS